MSNMRITNNYFQSQYLRMQTNNARRNEKRATQTKVRKGLVTRQKTFLAYKDTKFSLASLSATIKMWCLSLFTSLLFVVCYVSSAAGDSDHEKPKLLVLSLDAFRPEYFNRDVTPFMEQFREHGSYAPFMRNVFPTKTFVNHFSIATGEIDPIQ